MDEHGNPTAVEAAEWLDRSYPGWADKVNTTTLKMLNGKLCIGGQIGVLWSRLNAEFDKETGVNSVAFAAYDDEWINEVEKRRVPVTADEERRVLVTA